MPQAITTKIKRDAAVATKTKQPRSLNIAARGIVTADDMAQLMSALMSDLIEGRISPMVGNATCNASGKLLKVVEMRFKYGIQPGDAANPTARQPVLVLAASA